MVLGLCRLLLRDHHEAEDAAQQTFVSAYRALLRGTEPREPGPLARGDRAQRVPGASAKADARTRPSRRRARAGALRQLGRPRRAHRPPHGVAPARGRDREASEPPARGHRAEGLSGPLLRGGRPPTLKVSVPVVESLLFRARRRLRDTVRTVPRYAAGIVMVPIALRAAVARDVPDFDAVTVGLGIAGVAGAAAGGVAKLLSVPASVKVAATVAVVGDRLRRRAEAHPSACRGTRGASCGGRPGRGPRGQRAVVGSGFRRVGVRRARRLGRICERGARRTAGGRSRTRSRFRARGRAGARVGRAAAERGARSGPDQLRRRGGEPDRRPAAPAPAAFRGGSAVRGGHDRARGARGARERDG